VQDIRLSGNQEEGMGGPASLISYAAARQVLQWFDTSISLSAGKLTTGKFRAGRGQIRGYPFIRRLEEPDAAIAKCLSAPFGLRQPIRLDL